MSKTDNDLSEFDDEELANLIFGLNLDNKEKKDGNVCECGSTDLLLDEGNNHKICNDCGMVVEAILDYNPEFCGDNTTSSRYGCPSSYFYPKSAMTTNIKAKGYCKISYLQRQGQMPYKEKSLMEVLTNIQKKCDKYGITQPIIDNAKIYYKKITDSKHTKGERKGKDRIWRCANRRSMIAACLFHACKIQGEPRDKKEIADIYDLEIKDIGKGYKKFLEILPGECNNIITSQPSDFIERHCTKLDLPSKYIKLAKDTCNNLLKLGLVSCHEPPSVAAGVILLLTNLYNLPLTKLQIEKIFGKSSVTISKTLKKIQPYHQIITNNKITDMIIERKTKNNSTNVSENNFVVVDNTLTESDTTTSETKEIIKKKKRGRKPKNKVIDI